MKILKTKKMFVFLGNNCPQVLVQLEDYVIHAIIAILEGKSTEVVISTLHFQILLLEDNLGKFKLV
jgi:hypothetical protein